MENRLLNDLIFFLSLTGGCIVWGIYVIIWSIRHERKGRK